MNSNPHAHSQVPDAASESSGGRYREAKVSLVARLDGGHGLERWFLWVSS